jgi:hypothetical protein
MLIAPLLVLVGWVFNRPLILRFDGFEATTLLLSVVVMTYLISDGRSNYFEGLMLIGTLVLFFLDILGVVLILSALGMLLLHFRFMLDQRCWRILSSWVLKLVGL